MPAIETVEVELPEPAWRRALLIWLRQILSDTGLDILASAIRRKDPALIRGETWEWDEGAGEIEGACLLAFPGWKERRIALRDDLEMEWIRVQWAIDGIAGATDPSAALILWYDSQPEAQVMAVLLVEIEAEIKRRGTL